MSDVVTVREAVIPDDSADIVRVSNCHDTEPLDVPEFERLYNSWSPSDPRTRLVATAATGRVIGTSHCRRRQSNVQGGFFLHLYVDPSHEGRGVGRKLLEQSEMFAARNGAIRVTSFVPDACTRGRRFAELNGYYAGRHLYASVMDVASVTEGEIDQAVRDCQARLDVTFTTLAEIGHTPANEQRLAELNRECDLDEPASAEYGVSSLEDYRRSVLEASWFRPEGVMIATMGDEWVGVHTLGPLKDSPLADMTVDFTGVRRPYRGHSLGRALKLLGVRFARKSGGTRLLTHNDSTNEPMLAINRALGYRPLPGWLLVNKDILPLPNTESL